MIHVHVHVSCMMYNIVTGTCTCLHKNNKILIIMARRAIPMIAFPRVRTIYIYIYVCGHLRVLVVYVVKEVTSFPGTRSINGRGA